MTGFVVGQSKRPQKKVIIPIANGGVTYEPDADLFKQMQSQITVIESKEDWKTFNRQRPTENKTGSLSAYIAEFSTGANGDGLVDVIVVNGKANGKFYEIRGFDFSRPFERLMWTSGDIVQFDQWVNPRNGGRYAVNLKSGKVVSAGYLRTK